MMYYICVEVFLLLVHLLNSIFELKTNMSILQFCFRDFFSVSILFLELLTMAYFPLHDVLVTSLFNAHLDLTLQPEENFAFNEGPASLMLTC